MKISKLMVVAVLVCAVTLAACAQPENAQVPSTGQATATADTMMGTEMPNAMEETDTMAETPDAMMGTPTGDAMMDKTPDAMMEKPTEDSMMEETSDAMMEKPTEDAMMEKTPDAMMAETPDAMMNETPGTMMESPGWFSTQLTDVLTGDTFTINDFKGKVVVVYNAAATCADCLKQGQQLQTLVEMLGMDSNVVVVGLTGDPSNDAAALKSYVEDNRFEGNYAIAPQAVRDEFSKLYGAMFFDPSTTSLLIIDTKGEVHRQETGVMDADALKEIVAMYSGM